MRLDGKNVILTGATGGIGREMAFLLAERDCKLALIGRNKSKLEQLRSEIGGNAKCFRFDLKDEWSVKISLRNAIRWLKEVDVAITLTGVLIPNPVEEFTIIPFLESIEVNFLGILRCLEILIPHMASKRGGIIAITSTLPCKRGLAGWSAYVSSKAALSTMVESLRVELAPYGVKVILIKPGSVKTPMIEGLDRPGAISAKRAAEIILKGLEREKRVIEFPLSQVMMQKILDILPPFAYDFIPAELMKGGGYPEVKRPKF